MHPSQGWFAGFRALLVVVQSLAPWAAPLDVQPPRAANAQIAAAVLGWVGVAALVGGAARWLEQARFRGLHRWMTLATALVALAVGAVLPRWEFPLGAGVWVVAPLLWLTLGAVAFSVTRRETWFSVAAAWLVLCVATAWLSYPRLRDRIAMWRAVVAQNPAHARGHVFLAESYRASGEAGVEFARAEIARCLHADPRAVECLVERARDQSRAGEHARAAADCARALELDPDDRDCAVLRAVSLSRLNPLPPEALAAARRAVEVAPDDGSARVALAVVLDRGGDSSHAAEALRAALARGGGIEAQLLATTLALRENRLDDARRSAEAAVRLDPNDARAQYNVGLIAQREGHYNLARESYLRALRDDPDHYASRFNLAVLTRAAGALDESRHHLESLLRAHPGDHAAVTLLAEIERQQRDAINARVREAEDGGAP